MKETFSTSLESRYVFVSVSVKGCMERWAESLCHPIGWFADKEKKEVYCLFHEGLST